MNPIRLSVVVSCVLACVAHASLAATLGAEYAIRWDPSEGGPRSFDEISSALGLPIGKKKSYEVRYFTVAAPAGSDPERPPIARERDAGGVTRRRRGRGIRAVAGRRSR